MEKHTFEPIFGFNLAIDHSCEKTGEFVIQSLGVHKDAQERFSEYKKLREEFTHRLCPTDVLLKGRSAPQPTLPTWMEQDLDQEFALPFATSLYYHKKIQVEEKTIPVSPDVLDAIKRKKWEIENNFERELNYFRNHARYNPIRNLRDCRRPGCAIHRTTAKENNHIRYLFEQSLLEETKILISKISLNDSQDFVYTSIPSFYLFQDLINLTKIVEKLPIRRLRINLIDSEYTEWLSIFRDLLVLNNKTGNQNSIYVKPSVKVEEGVIGVTASRDPTNEPINVAKLLEINDTIYQFVEWFNNYTYPKITHMSIIMYNNLNSYVEECKLNVSARSHVLVSCACQCSSAQPLDDIHNTIIQEMSSIVAPHCRYLQLHADTSIESPNSPIKLRIYDSTSKLRKYYDFSKKTFKTVPTPSATHLPSTKPVKTTKTTTKSTSSNGNHKSHVESKDPPITIPQWAAPLSVKESYYVLDVIKQSKSIDTITFNDVGKQYYLIGRNADVCDIELKHPFISRQHAVIFFNVNEEPYITDLSSAHGTLIDSEKIQANVPYPLQEGNIIRFGTSSRKYVVVKKTLETASSEDSGNPDDDSSDSSSSDSSSSSDHSDTAKRTSSMMSINYLLESNDNDEDEPSYDSSPKKKKANKNL